MSPLLLSADWNLRFLNAPPLWVVVLFIVPAVIAAVTILYKREPIAERPRLRFVLIGLRTLAILALILILFRPVVQRTEMEERKPKLVVLVDDSASMTVKDAYVDEEKRAALATAAGIAGADAVADTSRLDLVKGVWNSPVTRLREKLAEKCDLAIFSFGTEIERLSPDSDLSSLDGAQASTQLGEAVYRAIGLQKAQNVAGIVAITDGRSNEGRSPAEAAAWLAEQQISTPVFSVGVGDPDSPQDIVLDSVTANPTVLANDEVIFEATVRATGFEGATVKVELSEDGGPLATATLVLAGDDSKQRSLLYHRPTQAGLHKYTVTVVPEEGAAESRQDNNSRVVTVNVINRKINVLYVEGYPRWEYRYLTHALIRDEESVTAKVLLLSADPNFVQESSTGLEPLAQFPSGKELFDFDVVIFGDVDPDELGATSEIAAERMAELEKLVEELGGGFAMIAGESDSPRRYRGTPIEKILPVVIESDEESLRYEPGKNPEFRPRITEAGRGDPITLLEKDPEDNRRLFEDESAGLQPFNWFYPAKKAKTASRVLMEHPEAVSRDGGRYPIFVTGFYGTGRTFFSAVDSTWRWRYLIGNQYFYRFWSQVVRYLATNRLHTLNRRFELYCDKSEYNIGEKVTLTAKVRDQDFEPSERETQEVKLRAPGALQAEGLELAMVPGKPGSYTKTLTATQTGTWTAFIEDPDQPGEDRAQTISFEVMIPSIEQDNAILDKATLEALAQRTGGKFVPLHSIADLPALIEAKPDRVAKDTENRELWDDPLWLALIALLLGTEWILRKTVKLL